MGKEVASIQDQARVQPPSTAVILKSSLGTGGHANTQKCVSFNFGNKAGSFPFANLALR